MFFKILAFYPLISTRYRSIERLVTIKKLKSSLPVVKVNP